MNPNEDIKCRTKNVLKDKILGPSRDNKLCLVLRNHKFHLLISIHRAIFKDP